MKLKKNPKKDLNLKRGLYFVIGLLFLLALIYIALEWKTISDNDGYDIGSLPKQEVGTKDSKIVIETQVFKPGQNQFNKLIDDPEEVKLSSCDLGKGTSFFIVEKPPIFPGCESNVDKKNCFNQMISKHMVKNLNCLETTENLCVGRVVVHFTIEKNGDISEIIARGSNQSLELAAIEAIEKLPQLIPAKHHGKAVKLPFTFPIIIN